MKIMRMWRKEIKIELRLDDDKYFNAEGNTYGVDKIALLMRKLIYVERSPLLGTRL